jgi:hypothetical protein
MPAPMTDLDKQLQEIALMNWAQFVALIGEDAMIAAKICLLRKQDYSYGEIAMKLKVNRDKASYECRKCN